MAATRRANGQFQKGHPGGPGLPKGYGLAEYRQALREAVSPDQVRAIVGKLVELATSDDKLSVQAAREILDRIFGKAPAHLTLAGGDAPRPPAIFILTPEQKAALAPLAEQLRGLPAPDTH